MRHVLSNSKSWSVSLKSKKEATLIHFQPYKVLSRAIHAHSYLLTFWAWSNIIAFREMSWSSSTLVKHYACSLIKSIKSGSPKAVHLPEKKERVSNNLTRAKKRGKMEKPKSNTTQKDIHPSHTHAHDQVLKMTWSLKDKIFDLAK